MGQECCSRESPSTQQQTQAKVSPPNTSSVSIQPGSKTTLGVPSPRAWDTGNRFHRREEPSSLQGTMRPHAGDYRKPPPPRHMRWCHWSLGVCHPEESEKAASVTSGADVMEREGGLPDATCARKGGDTPDLSLAPVLQVTPPGLPLATAGQKTADRVKQRGAWRGWSWGQWPAAGWPGVPCKLCRGCSLHLHTGDPWTPPSLCGRWCSLLSCHWTGQKPI